MSRDHEEMLARVRVSERIWSESDLYWRTDRWAEDGRGNPNSSEVMTCTALKSTPATS